MVIMNGWPNSKFLGSVYDHYVCQKVAVPGNSIEEPYYVLDKNFGNFWMDITTIQASGLSSELSCIGLGVDL